MIVIKRDFSDHYEGLNMKEKLLLIAPLFFGYYLDIIDEAEREGYEVTYVCDAPSNSNISKAVGRINKNLINKVIRSIEKSFSMLFYVFLILSYFHFVSLS